jgi:hypothetical protein
MKVGSLVWYITLVSRERRLAIVTAIFDDGNMVDLISTDGQEWAEWVADLELVA